MVLAQQGTNTTNTTLTDTTRHVSNSSAESSGTVPDPAGSNTGATATTSSVVSKALFTSAIVTEPSNLPPPKQDPPKPPVVEDPPARPKPEDDPIIVTKDAGDGQTVRRTVTTRTESASSASSDGSGTSGLGGTGGHGEVAPVKQESAATDVATKTGPALVDAQPKPPADSGVPDGSKTDDDADADADDDANDDMNGLTLSQEQSYAGSAAGLDVMHGASGAFLSVVVALGALLI